MAAGPSQGLQPNRADRWIGLVLGLAFLALYLRTLCPTVYLGDSGDFCTAIVTGGVPHPPGYPLFGLLGRLALHVVPFGEPAYRIGCLVALTAAAAVAVLYFLAREVGCRAWTAAAAAAAYGTGYTFWSQSVRVEVYSLNVLLAALLLLAAFRYGRGGRSVWLTVAALAATLGLAHHLTSVLLWPAALILGGRRLWTDPGRRPRLWLTAAVLAIGPSLYLVLMLWARGNPLHNWGDCVSLPALWDHASARVYRAVLLSVPVGKEWGERLATTGRLYLDSFPYLMAALPFLGGWALLRRDRQAATVLLTSAAITLAYDLCYDIVDPAPFYLIAWLILAVLAAAGLEKVAEAMRTPRRQWTAALLLCVAIPATGIARNGASCDLSRATWVRDLARDHLESTDPGGVLVSHGMDAAFPIWYCQDVLKVRPDVIAVDRMAMRTAWLWSDFGETRWYFHRLRKKGVAVPLEMPKFLKEEELSNYLIGDGCLIDLLKQQMPGRAVFLAEAPRSADAQPWRLSSWLQRGYNLVPSGVNLRLSPKGQTVDLRACIQRNEALWSKIALPDLAAVRTDQEMDPNYVRDHYANGLLALARLNELDGNLDRAAAHFRRVREWAPEYQPAIALQQAFVKRQAARQAQG